MVVCRNRICAVGGGGRNNSNNGQQGSTRQENKIASRRLEVLTRDETSNLVIWIKAFLATLCHLNNMWLQPVPERLHLKEGQGMPHCILLQDKKCPSYSPTECVPGLMAKKRRVWAMKTPPPHSFPQTHPEHIQRGRTEQVHRTHRKRICHCLLSKDTSHRRNSCKDQE